MSELTFFGVTPKDLGSTVERLVRHLVDKKVLTKNVRTIGAKKCRAIYDSEVKQKVIKYLFDILRHNSSSIRELISGRRRFHFGLSYIVKKCIEFGVVRTECRESEVGLFKAPRRMALSR